MTAQRQTEAPVVLHTIPEASALLRIGRATLYRMIERGEVESIHIGRRHLVPAEAVGTYLANKRKAAAGR